MKIGEKTVTGIWKWTATGRYTDGDFVVYGDKLYRVSLGPGEEYISEKNPESDTAGNYSRYMEGEKVKDLEEYWKIVKGEEDEDGNPLNTTDSYVTADLLNEVLHDMYFGIGKGGEITAHIDSEGKPSDPYDKKFEGLSEGAGILDNLLENDNFKNGIVRVSRSFSDVGDLVGLPKTTPPAGRCPIVIDRSKCERCWNCCKCSERFIKTTFNALLINNLDLDDEEISDLDILPGADKTKEVSDGDILAVSLCPYGALSYCLIPNTTEVAPAEFPRYSDEVNRYRDFVRLAAPKYDTILYGVDSERIRGNDVSYPDGIRLLLYPQLDESMPNDPPSHYTGQRLGASCTELNSLFKQAYNTFANYNEAYTAAYGSISQSSTFPFGSQGVWWEGDYLNEYFQQGRLVSKQCYGLGLTSDQELDKKVPPSSGQYTSLWGIDIFTGSNDLILHDIDAMIRRAGPSYLATTYSQVNILYAVDSDSGDISIRNNGTLGSDITAINFLEYLLGVVTYIPGSSLITETEWDEWIPGENDPYNPDLDEPGHYEHHHIFSANPHAFDNVDSNLTRGDMLEKILWYIPMSSSYEIEEFTYRDKIYDSSYNAEGETYNSPVLSKIEYLSKNLRSGDTSFITKYLPNPGGVYNPGFSQVREIVDSREVPFVRSTGEISGRPIIHASTGLGEDINTPIFGSSGIIPIEEDKRRGTFWRSSGISQDYERDILYPSAPIPEYSSSLDNGTEYLDWKIGDPQEINKNNVAWIPIEAIGPDGDFTSKYILGNTYDSSTESSERSFTRTYSWILADEIEFISKMKTETFGVAEVAEEYERGAQDAKEEFIDSVWLTSGIDGVVIPCEWFDRPPEDNFVISESSPIRINDSETIDIEHYLFEPDNCGYSNYHYGNLFTIKKKNSSLGIQYGIQDGEDPHDQYLMMKIRDWVKTRLYNLVDDSDIPAMNFENPIVNGVSYSQWQDLLDYITPYVDDLCTLNLGLYRWRPRTGIVKYTTENNEILFNRIYNPAPDGSLVDSNVSIVHPFDVLIPEYEKPDDQPVLLRQYQYSSQGSTIKIQELVDFVYGTSWFRRAIKSGDTWNITSWTNNVSNNLQRIMKLNQLEEYYRRNRPEIEGGSNNG